jgi:hypothetical protein
MNSATIEPQKASSDIAEKKDSVSSESDQQNNEEKEQDISIFNPKVRGLISTSVKSVLKSSIFLSILFLFLLILFYGMSWNPKDNYIRVKLAIVDLDGGMIGQALVAAAKNPAIPFSVTILTDVLSLESVEKRVDVGDFNAALVANPNASSTLLAALMDPSAKYIPSHATSFIFDEGRGGAGMVAALRGVVPPIATSGVKVGIALALFKQLSSDPQAPIPLSRLNPTALLIPVGTTEINLHPVEYSGENSAAGLGANFPLLPPYLSPDSAPPPPDLTVPTAGFIDNWVIAMISVNIIWALHLSWNKAGIRRDHQFISHVICLLCMTSVLALWPPAILRFFGASLDAARYFRMWGFIWLGMITFGTIILALYGMLGAAGGAGAHGLFMLLNFIVGPGLAPLELLYPPFVLGEALPLQNAMMGTRTILFGSYDILARCAGVLCGWICLSLLVLVYLSLLSRRRQRAAAAEAAEAAVPRMAEP